MKGAPISSECPKCGQERVQDGYQKDELVQMLRTGAAIQAYCSTCDHDWEMPPDERADVARALNK